MFHSQAISVSHVFLRTNTDLLQKGLRLAQDQQVAVSRQVKSFIDMRQPINAGQFIYAHVDMVRQAVESSVVLFHIECVLEHALCEVFHDVKQPVSARKISHECVELDRTFTILLLRCLIMQLILVGVF